jgi:hypothetical protein
LRPPWGVPIPKISIFKVYTKKSKNIFFVLDQTIIMMEICCKSVPTSATYYKTNLFETPVGCAHTKNFNIRGIYEKIKKYFFFLDQTIIMMEICCKSVLTSATYYKINLFETPVGCAHTKNFNIRGIYEKIRKIFFFS